MTNPGHRTARMIPSGDPRGDLAQAMAVVDAHQRARVVVGFNLNAAAGRKGRLGAEIIGCKRGADARDEEWGA